MAHPSAKPDVDVKSLNLVSTANPRSRSATTPMKRRRRQQASQKPGSPHPPPTLQESSAPAEPRFPPPTEIQSPSLKAVVDDAPPALPPQTVRATRISISMTSSGQRRPPEPSSSTPRSSPTYQAPPIANWDTRPYMASKEAPHPLSTSKLSLAESQPKPTAPTATYSGKPPKKAMSLARQSLKSMNDFLLEHVATACSPPAAREHSPTSLLQRCPGLSIVALVGLLALVSTIPFLYWIFKQSVSHKIKDGGLCESEDCKKHLYLLQKAIDYSTNPCTNFTQYVCGRWEHNPTFKLSRSVHSDMVHAWLSGLNERLYHSAPSLSVVSKAVAMFYSCMTTGRPAIDTMKDFMNQRGLYWPEETSAAENSFGIMLDLAFNWKVPLLFRLRILRVTKSAPRRRILFGNNKLLPEWHLVYKQMLSFQIYRKYWHQLFTIFAGNSDYPSDKVIKKSFDMQNFVFETLLGVAHETQSPLSFTVKKFASAVNYRTEVLLNIMNNKIRLEQNIKDDDVVIFTNDRLLVAIRRILEKYSDTELRSYLSWLFVQQYGGLASPDQVLVTLFGDERSAEQERPLYCAREVEASYHYLDAATATQTHFSAAERLGIEDFFKTIVEAAIGLTSTAHWMDEATKAIAAEKFKKLRTTMWPRDNFTSPSNLSRIYAAFPDNASSLIDFWIQSRRAGRNLFGSPEGYEIQRIPASSSQPYLHYVNILNAARVAIGTLSGPAYYTNGTKGMLYGGLGYWYSQTIVGAVNEGGVKVDPKFRVGSSWLSESTQKAYDDRVNRCARNGGSIFPEVPAMEIAFAAFQAARSRDDVVLVTNFTEEQTFFLTACYMSCAYTAAENLDGGDCNKAMANFESFAKAFQCPAGSAMNPRKKCGFFN
ncbi:hypothetical protein HPB48_012137 [Haemaphysalis longicornis]|uniref:Uncharacterized protein n=1 Tax=Haemaphysalis longicornis TaxID=44386 RepID=A0A9J6FPP6_HAELO|nr:hypothetical protein HPB48_012137 [Haemaphysalis longicornis]